ncbi:MAG: hypothetical protein ACT4OZ_17150 [Gemmatimonadota bacterium]
MIRHLLVALFLGLTGAAHGDVTGREPGGNEFLADFIRGLTGSWQVEVIRADGLARPAGLRTFAPASGDGLLVSWEERDTSNVVRSRGFLGATDSVAGTLYYISVASGIPPVAVTGRSDASSRSIEWELTPVSAAHHPYNRGLVPSRLQIISPTTFDWGGRRALALQVSQGSVAVLTSRSPNRRFSENSIRPTE